MKTFALILTFLTCCAFGAAAVDFNKGAASSANYYTVIAYDFSKGVPIIEVTINGKKRRFMMDTGAMTAISGELSSEMKLKIKASIDVGDSGGHQGVMSVVILPEVDLGGVLFKSIPAVVMEKSFFSTCLGIDGVIGSNLLRNSIIQFSASARTITLTDQGEKLSLQSQAGIEMELNTPQSNPFIHIRFGAGDPGELVQFDSGSNGFYDLSSRAYEQRFKPTGLFVERYAAGGSGSMGIHGNEAYHVKYKLKIPELVIDGYTFRNISVNTNATAISRIGASLLNYGLVTVDYKHKRFYFQPVTSTDLPSPDRLQKSWPLDFVPVGTGLAVGTVWNPELKNSVAEGDELIRFGDLDFTQVNLCDLLGGLKYQQDTARVVLRDARTKALKELQLIRD